MAETEGNGKVRQFLIKVGVLGVLIFVAFFIGATRDWIGVTRAGAVDSVRLNALEARQDREEREYVRKELYDAHHAEIVKRLDRIEQLLLEEKRRR